jgi:c-di-GMP-binding flagellar brake protein YcgR
MTRMIAGNRRAFCRAASNLPVRYGTADYIPEERRKESFLTRRGVVLDMSGGGLSMLVTEDIPIGSTLLVELTLPGMMGAPLLLGEVVRKRPHPGGAHWTLGLRFLNVEQRVQDRIVGFVFKNEIREQLRKRSNI